MSQEGAPRTCRGCKYFANDAPLLVDGQPYSTWRQGDCEAAGTLHPRTMSWGRCWRWRPTVAQPALSGLD